MVFFLEYIAVRSPCKTLTIDCRSVGQWANCNHGNHRRDPGVPQNAHEAEVGWFVSYIYDTDGVSPNSKRMPQSNAISDVQN